MKFSCTQENLHQGLSVVSHIAQKNVNLPILGNILIKCDDKVLRFSATNLEIAINCVVRGKVEEPGEVTLPARLFADYIGLLPNERVDIIMDGDGVGVTCGSYQTKLKGINASEFPLIPSIERKRRFKVNVAALRKAIGQVLFAVAPNESRPEISGVLFNFTAGADGLNLVLAATDSYRLAERSLAMPADGGSGSDPVSVIVPARTVAELLRILGVFRESVDEPEDIEIFLGENQILFVFGNVEFVSRTIEGRYPDYRQLIPERYQTEVILSREELLRAVKATSLFSKSGLNDVQLSFSPDSKVQVSAMNSQTGEHSVELSGRVSGSPNQVTVNFRYFIDGVNNIDGDSVSLKLIDGLNPCVLRPASEGLKQDYLYIVMPIRQ